jgi:hypothetical protein
MSVTDPKIWTPVISIVIWLVLLLIYERGRATRRLTNQVNWSSGGQKLPLHLVQRGHEISMIVWGIIWAIPLGLVSAGAMAGGIGGMVMMTFFGSPLIIAIAVFSVNQYFLHKEIQITEDEVRFTFHDLLRKRSWIEPLSSYTGVQKIISSGRSGRSWHIELAHSDPKKRITLFCPNIYHQHEVQSAESEMEARQLASLLNKPILETTRAARLRL